MSQELVTITVDGKAVQVPKGQLLVEAAKAAGVEIPVFCYHPKLDPAGLCRMCLVQVDGMPKPVTACTLPVTDGLVVHTDTDRVAELRKGVLEFLLINHPLDCPVCDKGGECDLQDLTFAYGAGASRLADGKVKKEKAQDLGPFIVLDEERCILCRRCVRFDDEVAAETNLVVAERGHLNVVTTADGSEYDSYFSGNTIELCPVGALTSDLYRFKARPWDLSKVDSLCAGCSVGCNVREDYRFGQLLRLVSRENPAVDAGWLCDRGRFNYQYVNHDNPSLLETPLVRKGGELVPVSWAEAISLVAGKLREAGEQVGFIGGGRLSLDEQYALQKLARATFGTNNIDYRVAGQTVASWATYGGKLTDLDEAGSILIVDTLPAETAPVLDLRIRRALERKRARVAIVGAALPSYRGRHARVQVAPGQSAAVLTAVAAALAGQGAAEPAQALAELLQGTPQGKKIVIVWGGQDPAVGQALSRLAGALRKGHAVSVLIVGEQANSRGAEAMGLLPNYYPGYRPLANTADFTGPWGRKRVPTAPGLDTQGMLEAAANGQLEALFLTSANLLATYPDGQLARRALEAVPFLVVSELFLTETAQLADVVLPAVPHTAKGGSYLTLDGQEQALGQSQAPKGQAKADLAIFEAIAAAVGHNLFGSLQELRWERQRLASGSGAPDALVTGGSRPQAEGQGLQVVVVPRLYAGSGTALFDPGFADKRPAPVARLNPADFAGSWVVLKGQDYELSLPAEADPAVLPGTVQLIGNLIEAPANRLGAWVEVVAAPVEVG